MYLQQGDVLLKPSPVPKDAKELKGADALQHGEATGHAHRLHGEGFRIYEKAGKKHLRIVKGDAPVMLRHEEHKEFPVPPGDYEIDIVREYDHFKEESRRVAD